MHDFLVDRGAAPRAMIAGLDATKIILDRGFESGIFYPEALLPEATMAHARPIVGNWYQDAEMGAIFEVVAYDEEEESVEVQHLDGEIEEYDLDTWQEMRLALVAPPEDWRSGFELSNEDAPDPDQTLHPDDWAGALNHIEQIEPDVTGTDDDWQE